MKSKLLSALALSSILTGTAPSALADSPQVFAELAERAMPSVVNISTLTLARRGDERPGMGIWPGDPDELPFFLPSPNHSLKKRGRGKTPFPGSESAVPRSASLGTGFIISEGSHGPVIVTNNHVVADADEIKVTFTEDPSEKPSAAEVIGRDAELDIAIIKVKPEGGRKLIPLPLGDSDKLRVGEYVAAIGNPFGQGHSISHGIVSAKGRSAPELPLATYLQTDAPINPGNSGGPLLNLRGEVVAINNAIDARAQGIGFAIPVNALKSILPQLLERGSVSRGYLGVLATPLQPELARKLGAGKEAAGVLVAQVQPSSPAERAGLEAYDIITAVAGKPVTTPAELTQGITAIPVGQTVSVTVLREGRRKKLDVKLGNRAVSES
jgi:serine protease Do